MNEKENRELWISGTGCLYEDRPRAWGPGIRDIYILHYVNAGKGWLRRGGKTWKIQAGQCFFVSPGTLIHYGPDPEDPWSYGWIDFSGTRAEELLGYTGLSPACPVVDGDPRIREWIRKASEAYSAGTVPGQCRALACLLEILACLQEHYPAGSQTEPVRRTAERAVDYIRNNYRRRNLTVESMAEALHTSPASLYRSFMQEFRMPPKEYITEIRMVRAKALLCETDFPIKSIAYSVGYGDQMYFAKVFRSRQGCTPREFRLRHLHRCSGEEPE